MAEEVGAAYVSLIPSARGFSKMARRELRRELREGLPVPIVPEVDRRAVVAAMAGTAVPVDIEVDRSQVTAELGGLTVPAQVSSADLTAATRRAIRDAETAGLELNVDVTGPLRRADVDTEGRDLGSRVGLAALTGLGSTIRDGMTGVFTTILGSVSGNPIISTAGTALGVALAAASAPVLATAIPAAISGALIGGAGLGVIGLGAWLLREDPAVKAAAGQLASTAQSVFTEAASPLRGPFVEALTFLRGFVTEIGPDLKGLFAAVAPAIMPLTQGFAGFVEALLPGVTALVKAAAPFLIGLAEELPGLGRDLGAFFGTVAAGGPGALQFFKDMINIAGGLLRVIGIGIAIFANWYLTVRNVITGILNVLRMAVEGHRSSIASMVDRWLWLRDQVSRVVRVAIAVVGELINVVKGIPGRITGALGSLGNLLYQAGRNVVSGLINGIKSMFGALGNTASSLAGTIRNYLPFSPAKEGPLSGSGNPFYSGQSIAGLLAEGMESQLPVVASASSQLAGAVAVDGTGMRAAGGGSTPAAARIEFVGDAPDSFMRWMRENVRIYYGGDPAAAIGS